MLHENHEYRIGTLNLFNFLAPPNAFYDADNIYSEGQWHAKQRWTASIIRQMRSDIIGFQEVFSAADLQSLCASVGLKHMVTIDSPSVEQGFVFSDPVVALASRYPIVDADTVEVDARLVKGLGGSACFQFSRKPIRAKVQLPGFGLVRIYVLHLKSPRPISQPHLLDVATDHEINHLLVGPGLGRSAARLQRGLEAALVWQDVINQQAHHRLPTVVVGDFNADLDTDALACFSDRELESGGSADFLNAFVMQDAHKLATTFCDRAPTHYWGAQGRALDHILMSSEFDSNWCQCMAEVSDVSVYDQHLRFNDSERDRQCSDHAGVVVQFKVRD